MEEFAHISFYFLRNKKKIFYVIFYFLSFFQFPFISAQSAKQEVVISGESDDYDVQLNTKLPTSLVIGVVSYSSDVRFSQQEFDYLVDLPQNQEVSVERIRKAIAYVRMKNKFRHIGVSFIEHDGVYDIHFALGAYWTFCALKFHGILIGKDNYRQYYLMDSGDRFEDELHTKSVAKILKSFSDEGHFDGSVNSKLVYNNETQEVTTHLTLKRATRYSIGKVAVELSADEPLAEIQNGALHDLIWDVFSKKLRNRLYNKQLINMQTQKLKRVLAEKGFIHLTITLTEHLDRQRKAVDLTVGINVHKKKEFIFNGNSQISSTVLLDTMLEFGASVWMLPASILAEEISALYQRIGFWRVTIDAREEAHAYIFNITEGPRIALKTVALHNVSPAVEPTIKKLCFSHLARTAYYDADIVKDSINAMLAWYQKEGYLSVKIIKKDLVLMGENEYALDLTIHEGDRTFFGSVTIDGFSELEKQGPFAVFSKQDIQIPFDSATLAEQRKWLVTYFQKQGYLYGSVKPDVTIRNNAVDVVWRITPGDQVTFGKTVVQGSSTFPFKAIQRELTYREGESWDKSALRDSFLRLKDLDIFESIGFQPHDVARAEQEKPIILKLQKDDPYELRARFGAELLNFTQRYSFAGITYKAGGAFIYKNPFNKADQFMIDADFTRSYREFTVQYQVPWLFDRPIKTIVMGYANKYLQPGFMSSTLNVYEAVQSGFLLGLSRTINHIEWGLNVGFEWMKTRLPDRSSSRVALVQSIARAINFNPRLLDQSTPYFQLEPTMVIDYLDNKLNPSKGAFTVLSVKGVLPLKKEELNTYYVKMLLEQSFFAPLGKVVGALRVRLGHIFFRKFSSIMPIERFYLGGANSLRAYETDFAPPLGAFYEEGKCRYAPQGGKSLCNMNAELRFPVYKSLGGVVFQDLGALSSCGFADFKAQDLLASTGFGLRVGTPIGPLRFDMGWKWKKQRPDDRSFAWFLAFGNAF